MGGTAKLRELHGIAIHLEPDPSGLAQYSTKAIQTTGDLEAKRYWPRMEIYDGTERTYLVCPGARMFDSESTPALELVP